MAPEYRSVSQHGPSAAACRVQMGLSRLAALFLMVIVGTTSAWAELQNEQIGFSPNHVFESAIEGENVDILTGNVNLAIPLGQRYMLNEWFGYQVTLYYNSRVWKHSCSYLPEYEDCPGVFASPNTNGLGFNIHFGRIYRENDDLPGVYRYQTPSGAEHFFCSEAYGANCGSRSNHTFDMSTIRIIGNPAGVDWEAHPGDGTIVSFDHKVGSNEWYATKVETVALKTGSSTPEEPQQWFAIGYEPGERSIHQITDSADRSITFGTAAGGGWDIAFPAVSGGLAHYVLRLESATITDPSDRYDNHRPNGTNNPPVPFSQPAQRLTKIELPELSCVPPEITCEAYQFLDYDIYGSLTRWKLPTGAELAYHYETYKTSEGRPYYRNLCYKTLTITPPSGTGTETHRWTYTRWGEGVIRNVDDWLAMQEGRYIQRSNPYKVRVLDPLDNLTVYWFHSTVFNTPNQDCQEGGCKSDWDDGLLRQVDTYAGPEEVGAHLVRRDTYSYTYESAAFKFRTAEQSTANNVFFKVRDQETVALTPGGASGPSSVRRIVKSDWTSGGSGLKHDAIVRPREVKEYNDAELYRTIYTAFEPTDDFYERQAYVEVRDAMGQVVSRTDRKFEGNRLKCEVRRKSGGGTLPSDCDTVQFGQGDTVTVNRFNGDLGVGLAEQSYQQAERVIHGYEAADSYTTYFTYEYGVLKQASHYPIATAPWFAVDRDLDPNTGLVVASRDTTGQETDYTWDALGRLEGIAPELPERPTEINYVNVKETKVTQGVSATDKTESKYQYDDLGRLIREERRAIDGSINYRETQYDIAGRVRESSEWTPVDTLEPGFWTSYEYQFPNAYPGEPAYLNDPLGRVTRVTRPDDTATETTYAGLETAVSVVDEDGVVVSTTTYINDAFGRLVGVQSPGDGADALYEYDPLDNLVHVELSGATGPHQLRYFAYDRLGRLRSASNPESGTVDYLKYDARGNLLEYTDARGSRFVNTYDSAGRFKTKSLYVAGAPKLLAQSAYDEGGGPALGRLTTQLSYRIFQSDSQLVATEKRGYSSNNTACSTLNSEVSAYDGLNGRLSWSSTKILGWTQELKAEYCYDKLGNLYSVAYPDYTGSGRTRTRTSNLFRNGYLWGIQDLNRDIEYIEDVQYHPTGAVQHFTRGNGVINAINRDDLGRPFSFVVAKPVTVTQPDLATSFGCSGSAPASHCSPHERGNYSQLWVEGPYSYDAAGNVEMIGDNIYGYDQLNRLVGATIEDKGVAPPKTHFVGYDYDAFGNMFHRTDQIVGGALNSATWTLDPETNRIEGFTYDANGNLLRTGNPANPGVDGYRFDAQNRLEEVWADNGDRIASYVYDSNGYRVKAEVDGIETYYFRDVSGQVLSEFRKVAEAEEGPGWDRDYVYGAGQALSVVKNVLPSQLARPRLLNLVKVGNQATITVQWDPSPDTDVSQYLVIYGLQDEIAEIREDALVAWNSSGFQSQFTGSGGDTFFFTVVAVDGAANYSPESPRLLIRPFDNVPPDPPTMVVVEGSEGLVRVTWSATGDDVKGYIVERAAGFPYTSFAPVGNLSLQTMHMDYSVANDISYKYRVKSVDTAGNTSAASAPSVVVMPGDTIGPGRPLGVRGARGQAQGSVVLNWEKVNDPDVAGYKIYWSTSPNSPTPTEHLTAVNGADTTAAVRSLGVQDTTVYLTVRAYDSHEPKNYSAPSDEVAVLTRVGSGGGTIGSNVSAQFFVTQVGPAPPTDPSGCDYWSEDDDILSARVTWWVAPSPSVSAYRVYRADEWTGDTTTSIFHAVGEVQKPTQDGDLQFLDTGLNGSSYKYYIVPVNGLKEWKASARAETVSPFNPSLGVRNVIAQDGRKIETSNGKSRRVELRWSRVLQQDLVGYHVYRRCEWTMGRGGGILPSMELESCVHSWVRLTDHPVQNETFVDNPGGLGGVYVYAIRAVGPNLVETEVEKLLSVDVSYLLPWDNNLETYLPVLDNEPWQCVAAQNGTDDIQTKEFVADEIVELNRINTGARGTEFAEGDPDPSPYVTVQLNRLSPQNVEGEEAHQWYFSTLRWHPSPASDLAGYHVERANAPDGPWERLTERPLAWWETVFDVKTLLHSPPEDGCVRFRVIAVDEEGNKSVGASPHKSQPASDTPPSGHQDYVEPSCGETTLLPVTDLSVDSVPGSPTCENGNRLEWTPVLGAEKYRVYRLSLEKHQFLEEFPYSPAPFIVRSFYMTEEKPASEMCAGTLCQYVELGDPPSWPECGWAPRRQCWITGLEAYYVTAVRTVLETESNEQRVQESPKSNIVFWDCTKTPSLPGYVMRKEATTLEPDIFLASVADVLEGAVVESVCDTPNEIAPAGSDSVADAAPRHRAALPWRATQKLLTLGTVDPPYEILDLHVDHLGSTRVVTNEVGTVVSRHDFLPYGEELTPIADPWQKKMFTGHERDGATVLDYMFARHFSPYLMRFVQRDVGGTMSERLLKPLRLNLYSYADNNPLRFIDPDGRDTFEVFIIPFQSGPRMFAPPDRSMHSYIAVTDDNGIVTHTYNWNSSEDPNWTIDDPEAMSVAQGAIESGMAKLHRGQDPNFETWLDRIARSQMPHVLNWWFPLLYDCQSANADLLERADFMDRFDQRSKERRFREWIEKYGVGKLMEWNIYYHELRPREWWQVPTGPPPPAL